jgi:hypothetical protein
VLRIAFACVFSLTATIALAQTPQPFPRPGQKPAQPPPPQTTTPPPAPAKPVVTAPPQTTAAAKKDGAPTEAELGAPIYPSAVYLTSYDAGRGQRFYIFGATVPYADLVGYYKTVMKAKGDELYDSPPTHQFETAKFKEESMSFPPSVTIKDYTYGGSAGYPNPRKGDAPERYPTIIQIVPAPR